ncbi:MAG: hypothetical protein ABIA67_02040 [Candidatus Margulisiibacteriota bacterium]
MYEILINVLIFSGVLLLLSLTVAVVQGIIILVDIRKTVHLITEKLALLTSIFDVVSLLGQFGGRIKKKGSGASSNLIAAISGIKKGLKVLLAEKGGKKNGENI